jgi:hypothetical protein
VNSSHDDRANVLAPAFVFLFALFVYTRSLGWGLPAGDETWAADAIKPSAPLAVAYHNFLGHGWNSGWFWFKYPPFHAFVLCAFYAPYLAWLFATGGLAKFEADFPFGMHDPIASLSVLAWIGRFVSALMGAGSALLVYLIVVKSFGRRAAVCAALAVTLAYPMVFYSQTTNVEVPYLFWLLGAVLGAVRIVEGDARARWWIFLGAGAALSLSTKELVAGAIVGLPVVIAGVSIATRRPAWSAGGWIRGALVAAASFAVAMAVANNALFNPLGFVQRTQFLTQTLPTDIALRYAPYYFPIQLGGSRGAGVELAQLSIAASRLAASVSWPVLAISIAGWAVALRRRPAWALLLLAAAAGYYVVSVRAMLSLSLRYLLPITVIASIGAGLALGELLRSGRAFALRAAIAAAAGVWIFVYGWDVNRMMTMDGRYAAERWLAAQTTAAARTASSPGAESSASSNPDSAASARPRVEIYQNRTYLPRFPDGIDVVEVPYEQRDAAAFAVRSPDYVVLSSSGISGVTVRYKTDWQDDAETAEGFSPAQRSVTGDVMNYSRDANADFLRRLTGGELGFEEAARFSVDPWIDRPLIQSLNPEIVIYRHADARGAKKADGTPAARVNPPAGIAVHGR